MLTASVYVQDTSFSPQFPNCRYFQWKLPIVIRDESNVQLQPIEDTTPLFIYTREKAKDAGIGVTELLSHKLHGIDNTGNVKVWEAESILLYILLTNPRYVMDFTDK